MSNRFKRKNAFAVLASAAATVVVSQDAFAQAAEPPADELQEIVVTAQKRAQNAQDVGIALTALAPDSLALTGHQDLTALARQVPSLQVQQFSPATTILNIRGVSQNDFSDAQEAPIAFYLDEVYISGLGAITGHSYDIARVEVLRGPQGTLFGRNATGGLLQVVTAKPSRDFEAFLTVIGGSRNQVSTEGAISGPLSEHVRARLSFTSDNHDGYIKNLIGPDLGSANNYGIRFQIGADLSPNDTINLKVDHLRNRNETSGTYRHLSAGFDSDGLGFPLGPNDNFFGTCPGCDASGYRESTDPFTVSVDKVGRLNRNFWSGTLHYEHDFGKMKLTSISNYQWMDKRNSEDSDVSPIPFLFTSAQQKLKQWSQELRLSGGSDRFSWVIGAYAMGIDTKQGLQLDIFGDTNAISYPLKTRSYAVFGQAEVPLSQILSVTAGLRYSYDRKKYEFTHSFAGVTDFVFNNQLFPGLADRKFENVSAKIQLNAHLDKRTLLYAGVNRGTKAGGFGVPFAPPFNAQAIPFGQEVLTNFEGGIKSSPIQGVLDLNASVFHYNYKNYQAFAAVSFAQFLVNRPARVTGFEVEATFRPVKPVKISAFATHLFEAKVDGITFPFSGRTVSRRMPQSPSWNAGASLSVSVPLGSATGKFDTSWIYNSSMYFSTFNAPIDQNNSYVAGSVRASIEGKGGHWEGAVFVNNVANAHYRVYSADLSGFGGFSQSVYAQPRWFGVSMTYRY